MLNEPTPLVESSLGSLNPIGWREVASVVVVVVVIRGGGGLQHGDALGGAVEVGGGAAAAGGLEALGAGAQGGGPGPGAQHDARAVVEVVVVQVVLLVDVLQAGQHSVVADGAELVGEGAVEDQDVHGEHPLADGRRVLQHEALVDEERAAWEGSGVKEARQKGPDRARPR